MKVEAFSSWSALSTNAMFTTKDFEGALGTWSFDANGDTTLIAMVGNQVTKGEWAEVPADKLP